LGEEIDASVENFASAISARLTAWETSDASSYESAPALLTLLLGGDDILQVVANLSEARSYLSGRRRDLA
jgi:hypothetical protein